MLKLDRILLIGIVFLIAVKVMETKQVSIQTGNQNTESHDGEKSDRYSQNDFSSNIKFEGNGRILDGHTLDNAQSADAPPSVMQMYSLTLDRAKRECVPLITAQVLRWEERHTPTVETAEYILETLKTKNHTLTRLSYLSLPKAQFRTKVCPQIEQLLAEGAYNPHLEIVDRLIQAPRTR